MDVGLDRLIEMFEQRFGKPAATCLLLLIGLGVGAWAIHSIWTLIIVPVAQFGRPLLALLSGVKVTWPAFHLHDLLIGLAWGIFAAVLSTVAGFALFKYTAHRVVVEEMEPLWAEVYRARDELATMVEVAKAYGIPVDELKARPPLFPNQLIGESPLRLSRPDTESETPP